MGVDARIHRRAEEKQGPVTLTERRKRTADKDDEVMSGP